MRTIMILLAISCLSACTTVKMTSGGDGVRVAAMGADLSACEKRDEITVSVTDSLGPYDRQTLKIQDELEVLARNEASSLKADTVQAMAAVSGGSQKWQAFRCNGVTPISTTPSPDKAVTQPVKD